MSNSEQSVTVSCSGGLDLLSDPLALFKTPGAATILENMEVSLLGGYRRIDGHSLAVPVTPNGTSTAILGIYPYAGGLVACQGTGVYYTYDMTSWVQVNKNVTGANLTAVAAAVALPRASQDRNVVKLYKGQTEHGVLLLSDGVNEAAYLKITGTGASVLVTYKEITTTVGAPANPLWAEIYKERYIVSSGSTVYWSTRFEVDNFNGYSAGSVDVGDTVEGVKSFRDTLYIFCNNSIHSLSNIDENPLREVVTKNLGCLSGWSIQEIGGDLLFLSKDGIRTLAATARLGDVELSTVSRKIFKKLQEKINSLSSYTVTSVVIRNKSQYRIYFSDVGVSSSAQAGFIGTLSQGQDAGGYSWSTTKGIEVSSISSEDDANTIEVLYHGDYAGKVYKHLDGTSFNGSPIKAVYKSPDIDFGDYGYRKTLYSLKISLLGNVQPSMSLMVKYNFGSSKIAQPNLYTVPREYAPAIYGEALYNGTVFGTADLPIVGINIEGSGSSASFRFETNDIYSSYNIYGYMVDFQPSGRSD